MVDGQGSGGSAGTGVGEGGAGDSEGAGGGGGGFNGAGGRVTEEGRQEVKFEDINNLKLVTHALHLFHAKANIRNRRKIPKIRHGCPEVRT